MKLKANWQNLNIQYKNIIYWSALILLVDLVIITQGVWQYASTHLCRNYMIIGSAPHVCSTMEFAKYGYNWLSFSNAFIFLPVIVFMVCASRILDIVFAKEE